MIGADKEDSALSGIDVEIVNEIAKRANLKIEYIRCPWIRALELMKSGKADVLSSVYKKPDREEYMIFFDRPFLNELPIAFYYRKDSGVSITKYSDLYKYRNIAVLRGASYFPGFDKDSKISKYEVATQEQMFPMLVHNRVQVMAGYMPNENYYITINNYSNIIAKSSYVHNEKAKVFMALSKNSVYAKRINLINKINNDLNKEGFTAKVVKKYYTMYGFKK
jgi:polar amino acid transport system substrate-binding protein